MTVLNSNVIIVVNIDIWCKIVQWILTFLLGIYIQTGIFDPKRSGAQGFHEGIFDEGFGGFSTLRKRNLRNMAVKRRPEMDPRGFDGDAFTGDACQRFA